jgi:hypothetical protein
VTSPPRNFRVWCLSWDEQEEHGADIIAYDILTHDYGKSTPRGVVYIASTILRDAADAAEAYADYVYYNRDGYEASWPLVFRVRCADGSTADFEVNREYVPEFTASSVKAVVR